MYAQYIHLWNSDFCVVPSTKTKQLIFKRASLHKYSNKLDCCLKYKGIYVSITLYSIYIFMYVYIHD